MSFYAHINYQMAQCANAIYQSLSWKFLEQVHSNYLNNYKKKKQNLCVNGKKNK